jgi:IS30 family transposase
LKNPNSLFEIDVVDMGQEADSNNRYILTMVDVFSRYIYAQIMPKKTDEAILKAFKKMLKDIQLITRLQSDDGREFSSFKQFCCNQNIKQVFTIPINLNLIE